MTCRGMSFVGLLAAGMLGCQRAATPPSPSNVSSTASSAAAGPSNPPLILSPMALRDAFLIGDEVPVRWRFVGDRFVVESWNEPLPATLQTSLVEQVGNVYRIAGEWHLLEDGRRLHLSQLQADGPGVKLRADLTIETGPAELLQVEGTAYRLMDHPYEREVIPTETFHARLSSIEAVHLVKVEREGRIESLRLAGIRGPSPGDPMETKALERLEELLRGKRFQVRVYDSADRLPRRAHLYTAGFLWINLTLIDEGLAWHDKPNDHEWLFATHEDRARRDAIGIWSQHDATPPWWIPVQ